MKHNHVLIGGVFVAILATSPTAAFAQNHVLSVDGTGAHVAVADDPSLHFSGSYTIECWAKVRGGNYNPRFVSKGFACTVPGSYELLARSSAGWPPFIFPWRLSEESQSGPGGVCGLIASTAISDTAQWVHVAVVADAAVGEQRLYLNGTLDGTSPWTPSGTNNAELRFGRNSDSSFVDPLLGELDSIRIWNIARTELGIRSTINTQITTATVGAYPGLVSVWNFENGCVDDGGLNNGVLVGNASIVVATDIPTLFDCNSNGISDGLEISQGASPDCDGNGVPDSCDIAASPGADINSNGILDTCECVVSNYCTAAPNSVSASGALMGNAGTASISQNNLTLLCSHCPPNASGVFFYGPQQTQVAFGNGYRCVAGPITRLGLTVAGPTGIAAKSVNYPTLLPTASINAGSTWNFQFWYRNPAAGGAGFNLSDGLSIRFCP